MEQIICKRASTVHFWDGYAKWYSLWLEHTGYHDRIIEELTTMVKPGWKVLDIGAGSGILSLPLSVIGCDVTALEPSIGMRRLLHDEAFKRGIDWIKVDERTWESVPHDRAQNLDLILTCNSLHLTGIGFEAALEKVFHSLPKHVFVVTEFSPEIRVIWPHQRYSLVFAKHYETESSFAYHSAGEAVAHHAYKKGGLLTLDEESLLRTKLACKDGHLWLADSAYVGMYWWQRTE